ncbi:MAG: amino acid racemase, partial [Marinomonas sp.]
EEDWARAGGALADSAKRPEQAGATAILICANSMHKVYDTVAASVSVPVLHIADCVGEAMKAAGATNAALIGTRNVMTESFYRQRLIAHGVDLAAPDMKNVDIVDRIIYEELMVGKKIRDSERELRTIITKKQQDGLEAIVLACTELDMIVDVDANVLPIFDSTRIHCQAAADWILGE